MGVYLAIFQLEFFTAFLWLVECSVLFVFLLLLFFLNIKGTYVYTYNQTYSILYLSLLSLFFFIGGYSDLEADNTINISFYGLLDNYYEAFTNTVLNDLFGFAIVYYFINVIEFIFVGFLLLVGSVLCVNLYQMSKNVRVQNYNNYLTVFNFFLDFSSFFFLRRQNLIKQGNTKSSLKVFKKK